MLKVIVLYNKLFHYRIPIWNKLAEKCDLTVTYSQGEGNIPEGMDCKFKVIHLPAWTIKNRFVIQKCNINKLVKNYDVAVVYGDISWLKFFILPWISKTKVVYHSLGVSASYEKKYDEHKEWDWLNKIMFSKADALAFYTAYPIEKYKNLGIDEKKMFEAPNTVAVEPLEEYVEKDSILFIGTLYRQKGIQHLLDAYKELKGLCKLPVLNIVGMGPDFDYFKDWISNNKMESLIKLCGAVYDIKTKAKYFANALACISPQQAGLSVLESMGYGVPYITTKDAFTGGEIFNIHHGEDGVLMNSVSELPSVIKNISENPQKFIAMGENAKAFYDNNRKPQDMANGLWEAISYAIKL